MKSLLAHARYLALLLPAFALFSTLQIACTSADSGNADDLAHEDDITGGYGYGYGYRHSIPR
jgi:hypothetical protein